MFCVIFTVGFRPPMSLSW